jgi:hypothetical protein
MNPCALSDDDSGEARSLIAAEEDAMSSSSICSSTGRSPTASGATSKGNSAFGSRRKWSKYSRRSLHASSPIPEVVAPAKLLGPQREHGGELRDLLGLPVRQGHLARITDDVVLDGVVELAVRRLGGVHLRRG